MKRRFLLAAVLCLFLTACGTDAIPAQQTTDQITEQTAPATSICRATIMEINGNTLTVTPVEGSWELSSSDKFFLSAQHLDESVTPTVGMTLEITYDGSILETYPASFSGIETVSVIDEAPTVDVTDTHIPSKGALMNDLAYEIATGDSYDTQYKERGYYTNVVNNKCQYIICSGECSTGGYGIEITGIDTLDSGKVIITVEETAPAPDEVVTAALTYPNCSITFSYEPPSGVKIQDALGIEYECLDNHSPSIDDMKSSQRAELRRAIMVDGTLYLDTGYVSSVMRCGNLDGNIEKIIDSSEIPDEDGEANFNAEGWQRGYEEGTLDVLIDNEFCIFGEYGTEKAKERYIPQGVMQFMAIVDEVTDDGYVIVKADTQSERFPKIRKDVRCRLSIEAYDPGIYTDKLVPGNVVIVACKGIFEGEDSVTITDVYSFSPVGSSPCQTVDDNISSGE